LLLAQVQRQLTKRLHCPNESGTNGPTNELVS